MRKSKLLGTFLGLSIIFASVLTGCSSSSEPVVSSNGTDAKAPKEGGTLIVARKADATTLDPHFITNNPSANYILGKVYEGLVSRDKNMEYQPALATEWKQLDDKTWEFKLRQGVTFHDGTPFNAEAVKKTFDRIFQKDLNSTKAAVFAMVKEVKATDEFTVQFILDYPYAPLLASLVGNDGSIMSPKAIEQYGKEMSKHPVGTGPFAFESWTPGQEMTLVKNGNYWGNKAKVDKIVYKVVPEDTTRIAMVEAGEAHIADNLPSADLDRVQSSSSMNLVRANGLGVEWIGFNTKKKPFDDVRVRQAIAHAIEKDAIIQGVYNSVGSSAVSALSPKVIGYNPNLKDYDYDVSKAKALLAEAGFANGFKTSIITDDRKERINLAEVIQSQLKGIGIDLEIKVMEYGAYLQAAAKGEHEMEIGGWGNATGDGDSVQYSVFHSKSFGDAGNHTFYSNPEVDKLIEAARQEQDPAKRNEIYAKVQEIELNDAPMVPIRTIDYVAVTTKEVQGFWVDPIGFLMLNEVTIQ
ncbi:glutathione ABC transporter substrate-binding protein [Brevibacillus centrosporus]|uniref:glutathione ABC transporter substrate-binding protein n=1 Tax=Brevibacillus centrosporus TaxID=54910 RepID=UPI002E219571|nr:glutathione ABC transporter substrate-binding protein [Brevibacillus centrosporus]